MTKKKFYENYKGYVIMLDYNGQKYQIRRPKTWYEKLLPFIYPDFDIIVAADIYDIETAKNYIDKFLTEKTGRIE